jgi:lysophospholipase L1-like esterase
MVGAICAAMLVCSAASAEPARWRKEVDRMVAEAATNAPAEGGIVFVGSSSIRLWSTLAQDFPGLTTINHGFGGSWLEDSVFYIDELVLVRKPRAVVLYAGENDLAGGATPEKVAADFQEFQQKLHAALPNARLIYIGCKPSPSRRQHHEKFVTANALIAAECAKDFRCTFMDIGDAMVGENWEPREELFVKDRLHMNAQGYAIWTRRLAPLLVD